jgi:hypothetical protein
MPIGLWDVKGPTLYKQSAQRWLWDCQPYEQATTEHKMIVKGAARMKME